MAEPTSLKSLFPKGSIDGPIVLETPPGSRFDARTWHFTSLAMLATGIGGFFFDLFLLDNNAGNRMFGGPGQIGQRWVENNNGSGQYQAVFGKPGTPLADGSTWPLSGTWLQWLLYALIALGAIGFLYGLVRMRLRRRGHTTQWDAWAAARGLTRGADELPDLPIFLEGRDRVFSELYGGTMGTTGLTIGMTSFTTGSGKSTKRHTVLFAAACLAPDVTAHLPMSTMSRYFEDVGACLGVPTEHAELQTESGELLRGARIEVEGAAQQSDWLLWLTPAVVDALAERYPVQWQQGPTGIAVCMPHPKGRPTDALLDTLCAGTAMLVDAYVEAAQTLARSAAA